MIRRWQRVLNQINRMIDFFIVGLSYYGATCFWLLVVRHDPQNPALLANNLFWFALAFSVAGVFGYQLAKLYDSIRGKPFSFDVKWVLFVNAVTVLGVGALLYLLRLTDFSRAALALFYVLASALILVKRMLVRVVLSRKNTHRRLHPRRSSGTRSTAISEAPAPSTTCPALATGQATAKSITGLVITMKTSEETMSNRRLNTALPGKSSGVVRKLKSLHSPMDCIVVLAGI